MHFLILTFTTLAAASTIPTILQSRATLTVCPLLDTPQCCQVDVDGILNLTCESPEDTSSLDAFETSCAKIGSAAKCCTLPLIGDALLCNDP